MPVYDYQYLDANGEPTGETFQVVRSMRDPILTEHEGRPCERHFSPYNVPGVGGGARSWSKDEGTSLAHRFTPNEELHRNCPSMRLDADGYCVSDNDSHDRKWKKEFAAWWERKQEELAPQREAKEKARRESERECDKKVLGVIDEYIRRGHNQPDKRKPRSDAAPRRQRPKRARV